MSYDTYIINLKQDTDKYDRMQVRLYNLNIKLHYFISDNFWVEIDNQKDLNAVKKII